MNDMIIIGAGDFSKEIRWLIERINQSNPTWRILGYVDDGVPAGTDRDGLPVLGAIDCLLERETKTDLVIAIASGYAKEGVLGKLQPNVRLSFPCLVDPAAVVSEKAKLYDGVVICAGAIVMPFAEIREFSHVNWNATIGHDSVLGRFCTVLPGANVSGTVVIGEKSLIGTGACIIQGVSIQPNVTIGAGATVVKDIIEEGTYVGVPAKKVVR